MKEKIVDAFNQLAYSYEHEDIGSYNAYNKYYERPAMLKLLPREIKGLKVLDAGCAAGWYTQYFLDQGALTTAVDISAKMVEATKRRTKGRAEVLCLDLAKPLPFASQSFDVICSSLTLHYLEDWQQTFYELARILKPNGTFIFSVHHPIMDINLTKANNYFQTELLTEQWKRWEKMIDVQFYRRSLAQIINVTIDHFILEQLIEPTPTQEFQELYPESYQRMLQRPNFLIVKAKKGED